MSRARDTADQINRVNSSAADATAITVTSSENVGIGTTSPSEKFSTLGNVNIGNNDVGNPLNYLRFGATQHGAADIRPSDEGAHKVGLDFYTDGTGDVTINPTFAMRIDASGNVLVGKTSVGLNNSGVELREGAASGFTRNDTVMDLNRTSSDGQIMRFRKGGGTIGTIGVAASNNLYIGSTTSQHTGIGFGTNEWTPMLPAGTNSDNAINLGGSTRRFNDLYATNGTIQTSDFNEKQDIASLTATEMLVGKRISALFKTFRWKDRVVEKGDNARTHTGVIAQDVQAAFTAEGLDAGDYALFISSTWWETQTDVPAVEAVAEVTDEDGNVTTEAVEAVDAYTRTDTYEVEDEAPEGATERTRLGIRYPELLSFVAAYNEQRFASIEARLTALEA
jgi:hypothetical protein